MKAGLGLLDVVVALAIGSILSILVYRSIGQINRTIRSIESTTHTQSGLALFESRFSEDLNGAFAPRSAVEKVEKEKSLTPSVISTASPQKPVQEIKNTSDNKQEAVYKLDDVFILKDFSVNTAGSDKAVFTFITSNPLIVYGETAPRIARVSYVLQKQKPSNQSDDRDEDKKINLFKLIRYESTELDYKKFQGKQKTQGLHGYEILSDISQIEIRCGAQKEEKKEKTDAKKLEPKAPEPKPEKKPDNKKIEYERLASWDSQAHRADDKNMLPDFVELKGTICTVRCRKKINFTLHVPIFAQASGQKVEKPRNLLADLFEKVFSGNNNITATVSAPLPPPPGRAK